MTIFKTAYETTACQGFNMDKTIHELQKADINGRLNCLYIKSKEIGANWNAKMVVSYPDTLAIPAFAHPLSFELETNHQLTTVVDVRSSTKIDNLSSNGWVVRNETEFNFTAARGAISHHWVQGNYEVINNISKLPCSMYAQWISSTITRRFDLDPAQQQKIAILAGYFFHCQFYDNEQINEALKMKFIASMAKSVYATATQIKELIDTIDPISNVTEFTTVIKEVIDDVRLTNFNSSMLFMLVGNSFYGLNANELMAVALEHPPTWMTVVMSAIADRSFKNTLIGKLISHNKVSENDAYAHAYHNILSMAVGGYQW